MNFIVFSRTCDFVLLLPGKEFFSRVCDFVFILLFFFSVSYHDNSWKAQPIRTKFSHVTFDWNSSGRFEDGHRRSHVIPRNRGFLSPPYYLNTSNFDEI